VTRPTIERAFELARSGEVQDFPSLKRRLKEEGCRAVDALLAPRTISGHLTAICAAAFKPSAAEVDAAPEQRQSA
jgi:hypothetical protein